LTTDGSPGPIGQATLPKRRLFIGAATAAHDLLHRPAEKLERANWAELAVVTAVAAVPYGYTIGYWTSPTLALYTAIKFPAVLLLTFALTFPFGWVAARLLGLPVSLREAARLTTAPLAVAALLLASMAPPALLFTTAIEPPSQGARSTHHALYLFHTASVALAALFGTRELWRGLRARSETGASTVQIYVVWVGVYAFVAGEIGWILRPFVGSVFKPVEFLRRDAFDGNVYEFLFLDVLPYLSH